MLSLRKSSPDGRMNEFSLMKLVNKYVAQNLLYICPPCIPGWFFYEREKKFISKDVTIGYTVGELMARGLITKPS
jgi:hypothetical protein